MKSKVILKTNAQYRPPYNYNKLFGYADTFFSAPKNSKFLAIPVSEEDVVEKLKQDFNFEYSKPNLELSEFLKPISELQSTKIDVYEKNYPFKDEADQAKFEHMVSKIGGLISGHTRAFRTRYMMTILFEFKKKSPVVNRFSLLQWKLFSEILFGKAPTKTNLMLLTSNKKGSLSNYSHLKSQASSKKIIGLLLSDYKDEITRINSDFEDSYDEFKEKTDKIKESTQKKISDIKKRKKEKE